MARGYCKVTMVGNLGGDPEVRYAANGNAVANFNVATTEQWNDRESGERQERTEWHRISCFGKLAEIAGEYFKKGRQVFIEGTLRTNKYTDKDGIERYATSVIASEMILLGSNPANDGGRDDSRNEQRGGQQYQQRQQSNRPQQQRGGGGGGGGGGGQQYQQQSRQGGNNGNYNGHNGGGNRPPPQQQRQQPAEPFDDFGSPESDPVPF